jgi:hypothetical protein
MILYSSAIIVSIVVTMTLCDLMIFIFDGHSVATCNVKCTDTCLTSHFGDVLR